MMAGVDIRTVAELMGHKTLAMTMRYSHLAPDHKRAAVDRLEPTATRTATSQSTLAAMVH
jgi:site-specific recombinase XerD